MKKLLFLSLVTASVIFTNCGGDDPAPLVDEIKYDGAKYTIENGYILNYGQQEGAYYWSVIVTDGTYDDYTNTISNETTYALVADLVSITDNLEGEYVFVTPGSSTTESKFFAYSSLITNLNSGTGPDISEGTITITGTAPNYTFDVSAKADGKSLKGSFEGTFTMETGSSDESVVFDGTNSSTTDLEAGNIWDVTGGAAKTDGTSYYRYDFILTDSDYDPSSECPSGDYIYLGLYSEGSSFQPGTYTYSGGLRTDGTTGDYVGFAYGNEGGYNWSASSGTVTVEHGGGSKYIIKWEFDAYVGSNNGKGGAPNGSASGEYKGEFTITTSYYCT